MNDRPATITNAFVTPHQPSPKTFTWLTNPPAGTHQCGIYQDEDGVKWVIKSTHALDAVREVAASHLYRQLVGNAYAPEVQLMKQADPNQWLVASKWEEGLQTYDASSGPIEGVEAMFVASALIKDMDCIQKNIGYKNHHVFRYDFGSGLMLNNEADHVSEFKTVLELLSQAGVITVAVAAALDMTKIQAAILKMQNYQFDWSFWEAIYNEALAATAALTKVDDLVEPLLHPAQQREQFEQRLQYFSHFFTPNPKSPAPPNVNVALLTALQHFYEAISNDVQPFQRTTYATEMAHHHARHLQQHGEHPAFYLQLIHKAESAFNMEAMALQFNFTHHDPEMPFHQKVDALHSTIVAAMPQQLQAKMPLHKSLRTSVQTTFNFMHRSTTASNPNQSQEAIAAKNLHALQEIILQYHWKLPLPWTGIAIDFIDADKQVSKTILVPNHIKLILDEIKKFKRNSQTASQAVQTIAMISAQHRERGGILIAKSSTAFDNNILEYLNIDPVATLLAIKSEIEKGNSPRSRHKNPVAIYSNASEAIIKKLPPYQDIIMKEILKVQAELKSTSPDQRVCYAALNNILTIASTGANSKDAEIKKFYGTLPQMLNITDGEKLQSRHEP